MKKTIEIEFPDNFEFPNRFDETMSGKCKECPMCQYSSDWSVWCALTGDGDWTEDNERKKCPFYDK